MFKSFRDFHLFLIRFVIVGVLGYVIEVLSTGITTFVNSLASVGFLQTMAHLGANTQGHTGIMAFFVYCWAVIPLTLLAPILEPLTAKWLKVAGWLFRATIYGTIFLFTEFVIGLICLYVLHSSRLDMWDYSTLPFNVLGIITFVYFPGWVVAGGAGEWLNDRMEEIEAMIVSKKR